jgi:hypothetical protein
MWLATVELVHAAEALAVAIGDRDRKKAAVPGTVTIGGTTYSYLDTQPTGYKETDTEKGYTARKWKLSGFLTQAEWTGMVSAYDSWRNARINDPDSVATETVGTTVSFSTTEPPAASAACWYTKAPEATREGTLWNASLELVHAAEALAVALKQKDKEKEEEVKDQDRVDLGTYTIQISGRPDVVLTLTAVPNAFQDAPQLNLTAQGTHYLSGPTGITNVREIAGYTDRTGWENLRYWYTEITKAAPARDSWFPTTPPKASAENIVVEGLKAIRYNVTLTLVRVR